MSSRPLTMPLVIDRKEEGKRSEETDAQKRKRRQPFR